jgi:hypothetical protein
VRGFFVFVAYVCVATVFAAAVGIAYLWQSERIDDKKIFQMLAILHNVDVQRIADEFQYPEQEVPPEELSWEESQLRRQLLDRNYEAKRDALKRGRQEFDHRLRQLSEATERFDRLAKELENRLKQQGDLTTKENVDEVVRNLELMKPEQAKELLLMTIDDGRMNDVVMLIKTMNAQKLRNIIQQFESPDEIRKLYDINLLMLAGGPQKEILDQAMEQIKTLEAAKP